MWSAGFRLLSARHDVQPYRIGAIGLSTGADVLIETTAAQANGEGMLSATVLDGATARAAGDLAPLERTPVDALGNLPLRVTFGVISLLSGTRRVNRSATSLPTSVAAVRRCFWSPQAASPRRYRSMGYAAAAHAPLWALPTVAHTRAIHEADRYEARVVGFLDHALLDRSPEPSSDP